MLFKSCFIVLLSIGSTVAAAATPQKALRRRKLETETISLDPESIEVKADAVVVEAANTANRRRFVSYRSSEWEQIWLKNIGEWEKKKSLCHVLLHEQRHTVHAYLQLLCTSYMPAPYENWCVIDDEHSKLWFNTENLDEFELSFKRPSSIPMHIDVPAPKAVQPGPQHDHLVSRFIFYDEVKQEYYVEYIEPLVSHLRFPLARCIKPEPNDQEHKWHDINFKGWIIPPPPVVRGNKAWYFDLGASSWERENGGKSLRYLVRMWERHGIVFDEMYAYDLITTEQQFLAGVPSDYRNRLHFQQCAVAASPQDANVNHPFVPDTIDAKATTNDYVVLKVDIDSPAVEDGIIQYVYNRLSHKVDEILWEHHVKGNYLLSEWKEVADMTMKESYEFFLKLRKRGIRAHSWV